MELWNQNFDSIRLLMAVLASVGGMDLCSVQAYGLPVSIPSNS